MFWEALLAVIVYTSTTVIFVIGAVAILVSLAQLAQPVERTEVMIAPKTS